MLALGWKVWSAQDGCQAKPSRHPCSPLPLKGSSGERRRDLLFPQPPGRCWKGRVLPVPAMGQKLGALWNRFQGKRQVHRICEKVFDQYAHDDRLPLDKLHLVTLLAYDSINKCFPKPHKSPPSREEVEDVVTALHLDLRGKADGNDTIGRTDFCDQVLKWSQRDLNVYIRNKTLHILAAAAAMAAITKSAARPFPRVQRVMCKVPTPLLALAYAIGFAVLDDVRVG